MKNLYHGSKITALAMTGMVAGILGARAEINLTLDNPSSLAVTDVGLTAPDGSVLNPGGFYIGEYGFAVDSIDATTAQQTGLTLGSQFNSVCLSPSGVINAGTQYAFTYESFSEASPGINPTGYWSANGIQNAAYLWNVFGGQVTTGAEGAGLSLAMLEVLYNGGTTYGALAANTIYAPNFNGDAATESAYNSYLSYYEANAGSSGAIGEMANTVSYGIFVPTPDSGAGQEFIFTSPNGSNGNPVPEPTTFIAGALLFLPLGASALRIMRRKNLASV